MSERELAVPTLTERIQSELACNPNYFRPLGIGASKFIGGGAQGATIFEDSDSGPMTVKLRTINFGFNHTGLRAITEAEYFKSANNYYLKIDGVTHLISPTSLHPLKSLSGEITALTQVYNLDHIQKIDMVRAEGKIGLSPRRYLFSLDDQFGMGFVYNHIPGSDMRSSLNGGSLSPQDLLRIHQHLIIARDGIYTRGVIHHDIKPGNIVISPDGTATLIDFGVATIDPVFDLEDPMQDRKLLSRSRFSGSPFVIGTPSYLAPEAIYPEDYDLLTPKVDMYSHGVIAFEAVVGNSPIQMTLNKAGFSDPNLFKILSTITGATTSQWNTYVEDLARCRLNGNLVDGISQMIHPDVDQRDDLQFREALSRISSGKENYLRPAIVSATESTVIETAAYFGNSKIPDPLIDGKTESLPPVIPTRVIYDQTTILLN